MSSRTVEYQSEGMWEVDTSSLIATHASRVTCTFHAFLPRRSEAMRQGSRRWATPLAVYETNCTLSYSCAMVTRTPHATWPSICTNIIISLRFITRRCKYTPRIPPNSPTLSFFHPLSQSRFTLNACMYVHSQHLGCSRFSIDWALRTWSCRLRASKPLMHWYPSLTL